MSTSLWKVLYKLLGSNSMKQNLVNAAVPFLSWVLFTSSSLHISVEYYFHNSSESALLKILIYPVIRRKRLKITPDLWFTPRMKDFRSCWGTPWSQDSLFWMHHFLFIFFHLFILNNYILFIHISKPSSLILSAALTR